jgi:hypothetical protein
VILVALWRRGLLTRANGEKLRYFLGIGGDPLALSRRYPMWRILNPLRLLLAPRYAAAVAQWLEYRMNLFDGVGG